LIRPGLSYNGFDSLSVGEICTTCISLVDLILTLKDQTKNYQKDVITSSGSHAIFDLDAVQEFSYNAMKGGEDTDFSKRICQSLATDESIKFPSLRLFTTFRLSKRTSNGFGYFSPKTKIESNDFILEQFSIKMKQLIRELYNYSDKYTAFAFTDSNEFTCLTDACVYLGISDDFNFKKIKDDLKKLIDQNF
jgi:hypothetical protein